MRHISCATWFLHLEQRWIISNTHYLISIDDQNSSLLLVFLLFFELLAIAVIFAMMLAMTLTTFGRNMSRHFHSDSFNSIFSPLSDVWQTNKSSSHHSISLTIYVVQIMTMQPQWTMGFRDDKDDHDHEHDLWWFIGVARTNCVDLPLNCVRKALESLRLWFKFDMTWHPISQTFVSVTIF